MADRLSFHLIRVTKVVEKGVVEIDIEDPLDSEEIARKLIAKEFSSFLITSKEYIEDDNWSYQPKI